MNTPAEHIPGFPDFWEEPLGAAKLAQRGILPAREFQEIITVLRDRPNITEQFAEKALIELGYAKNHRYHTAAKALVEEAKNLKGAYHNPGHVFVATVLAYRLSLANGMTTEDTALNLLTMLGHELGHPGRKNLHPKELEEKAVGITNHLTQNLLTSKELETIDRRILATEFSYAAQIRASYKSIGVQETPAEGLSETIAQQIIHEADLGESVTFGPEINQVRTQEVAEEDHNPALLDPVARAKFISAFPPLSVGAELLGLKASWDETAKALKGIRQKPRMNDILIEVIDGKVRVTQTHIGFPHPNQTLGVTHFPCLETTLEQITAWKQALPPKEVERWEAGEGHIRLQVPEGTVALPFELINPNGERNILSALEERFTHLKPALNYYIAKDQKGFGKAVTQKTPNAIPVQLKAGATVLHLEKSVVNPHWTRAFLRDLGTPENLLRAIPESNLRQLKTALAWAGWNGQLTPEIKGALEARGISGLLESTSGGQTLHVTSPQALYRVPANPAPWYEKTQEREVSLTR